MVVTLLQICELPSHTAYTKADLDAEWDVYNGRAIHLAQLQFQFVRW